MKTAYGEPPTANDLIHTDMHRIPTAASSVSSTRPASTAAPGRVFVPPPTNALLQKMPSELRLRLQSESTRVTLERDVALVEAGETSSWTYLPVSGLVSLQRMTEDGSIIEVAMAGRDALVGFPFASLDLPAPHTAIVAIGGEALRVKSSFLQSEFERSVPTQRVLLGYWHRLFSQMAKGSACHRFHSTRQRLARWLLEASDRLQSARIEMTQERLAASLGIQRTGVTMASVALQDLGVLRARHGRITLVNRERLTDLACDCYERLDLIDTETAPRSIGEQETHRRRCSSQLGQR